MQEDLFEETETITEISDPKFPELTQFYITAQSIRINSFHTNVPFLYPLKTLENLWFSDVFRGYRNGIWSWDGLNHSRPMVPFFNSWKHLLVFSRGKKRG